MNERRGFNDLYFVYTHAYTYVIMILIILISNLDKWSDYILKWAHRSAVVVVEVFLWSFLLFYTHSHTHTHRQTHEYEKDSNINLIFVSCNFILSIQWFFFDTFPFNNFQWKCKKVYKIFLFQWNEHVSAFIKKIIIY